MVSGTFASLSALASAFSLRSIRNLADTAAPTLRSTLNGDSDLLFSFTDAIGPKMEGSR